LIGLRISRFDLQVGEVWESNAFRVSLPVRNVSNKEVGVRDIQAGCACLDVSPRTFTLAPGEELELQLTIDLTQRARSEEHKPLRPIAIEIAVLLEGEKVPRRGWLLEGAVRSRLTTETKQVAFGDRLVQGSVEEPRVIKVHLHEPGELVASVTPPQSGTVQVEPTEGKVYRVKILPSHTLPPGPFEFKLVLGVRHEGVVSQGLEIPVRGEMQKETRPFPAQVQLGSHKVKTVQEAFLPLRAPQNKGWKVEQIEIDSADLKRIPTTGGYRVLQTIGQVGDQSSEARFHVRKPGESATVVYQVIFDYYGEAE
jgi:hypothetical protein